MKYNFDEIVDRSGTCSAKWEGYSKEYEGFKIDEAEALPMWVADMEFRCMPEIISALSKRVEHGIFGYSNESAIDSFRSAACKWFHRRYAWDCSPGWMLFSMGVVIAINSAIQEFTKEGEGVIVQTPVYYPFMSGPSNNNRLVVENRLIEKNGHYEMDFEDLEKKASDPKNTMLILCSPHNPVARVWSEKELETLLEICRRNNLTVFSDELHADLIMPGYNFTSCGNFEEYHDILILAHSPSKTFNLAGLTSALITVPNRDMRDRLSKRMYGINRMPSSQNFGPVAGAAAYEHGDVFVDELVQYISGNVEYAKRYLKEHLPEIRIGEHEGTYLTWFDFRKTGLSDEEILKNVLEEAKVIGDPGRWFGDSGTGFVRFNYACPRAYVEEQMRRLNSVFGL